MLIFSEKEKTITRSSGGYTNTENIIRDTYVQLGRDLRGILYEPIVPGEKSQIAVVIIHSNSDYSIRPIGGELAKRGYVTFCGRVSDPNGNLDKKMEDINCVVNFLRSYSSVKKVVLMGHSGGATLMSAYQAVAENGPSVFQGEEKLHKCTLKEGLSPADGVMLLDANWGNGAMTLFSVDPAVIEEGNGVKLDPEFDIFNPSNGYDPAGSHYSQAFLDKFFAAQKERNNRLIQKALDRLCAIESGKGYYVDDEPFIVTGAAQGAPCNKLFPQDVSLFAHTKKAYKLLHKDGVETNEIVRCVRVPFDWPPMTREYGSGTLITTVRNFLCENAIPAGDGYSVREDGAYGIEWNRGYSCGPGNMSHVHAPTLCMGMTGGYEYLAAEVIYDHAASEDKSIAFVEGASHLFDVDPRTEKYAGQYGDTQKTLYDYVDQWLSQAGRFLD